MLEIIEMKKQIAKFIKKNKQIFWDTYTSKEFIEVKKLMDFLHNL